MPPTIHSIVESALYVEDVARSIAFYSGVLGLEVQRVDGRFGVLTAGAGQVLLVFRGDGTLKGFESPGGFIPGHFGTGTTHFAFGCSLEELELWEAHLRSAGVQIESTVLWPGTKSRSIYFRDPDGHLVEFVTPGVWSNY